MNNISKCIGIISWLPNDSTRKTRQERLEKLLVECDKLFNLPVMIIAQGWDSTVKTTANSIVYNYEKLGITGARKKLREKFLESNYDYLIMLDDDAELVGTLKASKSYLQQIDEHNGSVGIFKSALLKLFAIPKAIMEHVEYDNIEAEKGEGFEDVVFIEKCKSKFPNNYFTFKRNGLDDQSNSGNDKYSTWWKGQYVKKEMGDRSRKIIKEFKS
jgi:hypothetical protein